MLFGCGKKKYKVDYQGSKEFFIGAKDSYEEGTVVKLDYDLIVTDVDITFYVDDEQIGYTWDEESQSYLLQFVMPAHDVVIRVKETNSMDYYMSDVSE